MFQINYRVEQSDVLSNKYILANILRECVPEFNGYDIDFIVQNCFLDRVKIGSAAVHLDDIDNEDSIAGRNTDDVSLTEGKVGFDLLFEVLVPKPNNECQNLKAPKDLPDAAASDKKAASASCDEQEIVMLTIDLEAQQKIYPRETLIKRTIYYACREVGRQRRVMGKNFSYRKLHKVYSIWFLLNPANYRVNSISGLKIGPSDKAFLEILDKKGDVYEDFSDEFLNIIQKRYNADLLEIIFIDIADNQKDSDNRLIKILGNLFSTKKEVDERKEILENEFGVRMTREEEERFDTMCNWGEALLKHGEKKGRAEGIKEGVKEGVKATQLGNIQSLIKKLGCTIEYAMSLLSIPENEYEEYKKMLEKEGQAVT